MCMVSVIIIIHCAKLLEGIWKNYRKSTTGNIHRKKLFKYLLFLPNVAVYYCKRLWCIDLNYAIFILEATVFIKFKLNVLQYQMN